MVDCQLLDRDQLDAIYGLTDREREIFDLAATGLRRGEIAAVLQISRGTVRTHFGHIYSKLDIHSHIELVALAARAHCAQHHTLEPLDA